MLFMSALFSKVDDGQKPDGVRALTDPYCASCGACLIPTIVGHVGHAIILPDGSLYCERCVTENFLRSANAGKAQPVETAEKSTDA